MKKLNLYLAFLFTVLLAFQSHALKLKSTQGPIRLLGKDDPRNFYTRLGFGKFLQMSESFDASLTLANLYKYYIDNSDYFNYIQSFFCEGKEHGKDYLSADEYYEITDSQGVHRTDAQRALQLIKGTFSEATFSKGEHSSVDADTFQNTATLLFAESLSMVTFSYLVQGHQHSESVGVDLQTVETGLVQIFEHFSNVYPEPNCEEIEYLFGRSDTDKDNKLNLQEFHVFLAIYLRYYKYGLLNNRFAVTIMQDKIFQYVWNNEEGLGGKDERIKFLKRAFARFLQMNVYDKILNQMSHVFFSRFDTDGSGAIDPTEFSTLLSYFDAPQNEIDILFTASDTDNSGEVDFSEFTVTLTTLLRKLDADFGYSLIRLTTGEANSQNAYKIVEEATNFLGLQNIPQDKFDEIFESVDVDHNGSLDTNEFAQFISVVITFLKTKVNLQEEAQISAMAGLDIDKATPEDVIAITQDASETVKDMTNTIDQGMGIEQPWDQQLINDETSTIIEQIQEQTGASIEDIQAAIEDHLDGATIQDVIQAVQDNATENILDVVTEDLSDEECVTEEQVVEVIEQAIDHGVVDQIIDEAVNQSPKDILESVDDDVVDEQIADAIEESGISTSDLIDIVAENTGEQLTVEQVVQIIATVTEAETPDQAIEIIENMPTEDLIEAVTENVDIVEVDGGLEANANISIEDLVEIIAENTGEELTQQQIVEAIETATEAETPEQAIEVLENLDAGEIITIVTEQVVTDEINTTLEESAGITIEDIVAAIEDSTGETLTQGDIIQVIETITEADTTEDATEGLEQLTPDEIIEAAIEVVEEGPSVATIEEFGGPVEHVIDEATHEATEHVLDTVTEAVIDGTAQSECATPEEVAEIIEETIEGGALDDVLETIEQISTEQVIDAVSEAAAGDEMIEENEGPENEFLQKSGLRRQKQNLKH